MSIDEDQTAGDVIACAADYLKILVEKIIITLDGGMNALTYKNAKNIDEAILEKFKCGAGKFVASHSTPYIVVKGI